MTVYVKATRQPIDVISLGAYLDTVTDIAPTSDYDVWSDTAGAWVIDELAQHAAEEAKAIAEKNVLMAKAAQQVEIYTDAVMLENSSGTDSLMLTAWRTYRVALNRVDTTSPDSIIWPPLPTNILASDIDSTAAQ